MNIKEMSKTTGVSPRMLRHYEEFGLLSPDRTESGHRVFSAPQIESVQLIQRFNAIGFSLKEVKEIFDNPGKGKELVQKLSKIYETKKEELSSLKSQLGDLKDALKVSQIRPIVKSDDIFESPPTKEQKYSFCGSLSERRVQMDGRVLALFEEHCQKFARALNENVEGEKHKADITLEGIEFHKYDEWAEINPESYVRARWSYLFYKPVFFVFPYYGDKKIDDESEREIEEVEDCFYNLFLDLWKEKGLPRIKLNLITCETSDFRELGDHFAKNDVLCLLKYKTVPKIGERYFYFAIPYSGMIAFGGLPAHDEE